MTSLICPQRFAATVCLAWNETAPAARLSAEHVEEPDVEVGPAARLVGLCCCLLASTRAPPLGVPAGSSLSPQILSHVTNAAYNSYSDVTYSVLRIPATVKKRVTWPMFLFGTNCRTVASDRNVSPRTTRPHNGPHWSGGS